MNIKSKNFELTIDWKTVLAFAGVVIIDVLSRRDQLKSLKLNIGNKSLSLNQ